jgi:hypothetical protein
VLFAEAGPADQVPLVDLKGSVEARIKDRRQRDHALRKVISLSNKCQADPDDELGRTKIDSARGDFDLRIMTE